MSEDWYPQYSRCRLCGKKKIRLDNFIDLKKGRQLEICRDCLNDLNAMLSRLNSGLE